MTRSIRSLVAVLVGVALTVAACGDDGPGRADQAARAAELAAEFRASQTTTTVAAVAAEPTVPADDDIPTVTEALAPTVPQVEPTGVVIPVTALDNSFRPNLVEISVGDEVLWENRGLNEHNVLYVEGDDWGVQVENFQPGAVFAHVFTEPGEYSYFCSIHGNETVGMVGMIIVTG